MLKILASIKSGLIRLLEWAVIAMMAALVLDVVWQVATRYLLKSPSSWTDELATLLIIWVALLGASVAFIQRSHLGVDYFVNKFPARLRRLTETGVYLVIALFAAEILIYGGLKLVSLALVTKQVSPALGVPIGYVYLALPISGSFIVLFAVEAALERLVQKRAVSEDP